MFNYFIFDGHDSRDYGVYISGGGTFDSPARRYENISVPGRDGDLLGASTRLQNVTLTYPAGVVSDFAANIEGLRNMLLSTVGYAVLYDSYHPDEYRYAVYKGGLEQDPLSNLQAGEFEITFECKPQRYLFSGGEAHDLGTWGEVTELTGDIVTFEGAADTGIKSLTVQIEPVQSGSGDPSPSNIRPISGHTGVTVTRCGKNLLDKTAITDSAYLDTTTGAVTPAVSYCVSDYIQVFAGVPVYIPASNTARRWFYDANKTAKTYLNNSGNQTFTPTENGYIRVSVQSSTIDINSYQIELGSTATAYEPYTAETYPVSFPTAAGTVYGGTVDVVNGKLTVDRAIKVFSGSDSVGLANWRANASSVGWLYTPEITPGIAENPSSVIIPNIMSDMLKTVQYGGSAGVYDQTISCLSIATGSLWGVAMRVTDTTLTTQTAINAWLALHPVTVIYPLATPIEYDIDPAVIKTLKGSNNIWADTGPIALEYGKDPGKLANPTLFDARPVFRVFGYGTLNVGNQTVTIAQNPLDYIDIDSALMDCYCGATNANQYVTFSGNDFPVLPPGVTSITFSNTITQVLVTTNWWRV